MAETTLLRSSALIRNASVGTSPSPGTPGQVKTGELPLVQVKTAPVAPQFLTPPAKPVEILPPRDANSALRTGGLPMVSVKMTAQGPRPDDGQDKPVVILPPKGQKPSVAGGPPMLEVSMTNGGPQVQNPQVAQRPPQNASFMWSQSRGAGVRAAAHPVNQQRVMRVPAPKPAALPLPPVPELSADQLMLCRHLVSKYLMDLQGNGVAVQGQATSVEVIEAQVAVETVASTDVAGSAESVVSTETAESGASLGGAATSVSGTPGSLLVHLAEATIETLDQALVAVAIRVEASELAAAAAATAEAQESAPPPVQVPSPVVSSIPAAPSVSYMAGRAGGHVGGYTRPQRNVAQAPRRVARAAGAEELPMVQVKMDGQRAVVQNQAEVTAARAARVGSDGLPGAVFDGGQSG